MKFQDENLLQLMTPGLYKITCILANKVYLGESENLLTRLGKQTSSLTQNTYVPPCKKGSFLLGEVYIVANFKKIGINMENNLFPSDTQ